jgi:formylglycine-generating enzyme required for sulfatase activity
MLRSQTNERFMRNTRYASAGVLVLLVLAACERSSPPSGPRSAAESNAANPTVTSPAGIEMVLVPAGEFMMGDANGEFDEQPARRVRVSGFLMDRQEVTQAAFQAMMGKNPAKSVGSNKPVERVSWVWAVQYCNMRSLREGLQPCYDPKTLQRDRAANGYRLPTEAEWEYACRAGTTTRWSFGDDPQKCGQHAWFKDNASNTTHEVRLKEPNAWGLYDMHGNVAEWCEDYYAEAYGAQETSDPQGPAAGDERVLRGGSWKTSDDVCRSSARFSQPPGLADVCFGYDAYGFRCVRNAPAADAAAGNSTGDPAADTPPHPSAGAKP